MRTVASIVIAVCLFALFAGVLVGPIEVVDESPQCDVCQDHDQVQRDSLRSGGTLLRCAKCRWEGREVD